jgi:hypothetical protein
MPMRSELSFPARSQALDNAQPRLTWHQLAAELQNPDLQAVLIFSLLGLLACLALALFAPFSPDIAAALSQLS